jgi:hypothetical protein
MFDQVGKVCVFAFVMIVRYGCCYINDEFFGILEQSTFLF